MCQPSLSLKDKTEETTTPCPRRNTQLQEVGPVLAASNLPASTPPPAGMLTRSFWGTLFCGNRKSPPERKKNIDLESNHGT